jgi:long-chain acyl-CoA synthetase
MDQNNHFFSQRTLFQIIKEGSKTYPNRVAIEYLKSSYTYMEFYNSIIRFSNFLNSIGLKKGDTIGICAGNIPQVLFLIYSSDMLGLKALLLNPKLSKGELSEALKSNEITTIFTLDILFWKFEKMNIEVYSFDISNELELNLRIPYYLKKIRHSNKGKKVVIEEEIKEIEFDKDYLRTNIIFMTSGTTGKTKFVEYNSYRLNLSCFNSMMKESTLENESTLAVLPYFHIFSFIIGIHIAFCALQRTILIPLYKKSLLISEIISKKPTFFPIVPFILEELINDKYFIETIKKDNSIFSDFKTGFCGGDQVSINLLDKINIILRESGSKGSFISGYGMTEVCPISADYDRKMIKGSVGKTFSNVEIRVFDEKDNSITKYGKGELLIKAPYSMKMYCNSTESEWIYSGDIGIVNEEGQIEILGRKGRNVKIKGEFVNLDKVSNFLTDIKFVKDALVVKKGDKIVAYIVIKFSIKKYSYINRIKKICYENLSSFNIPDEFILTSKIEKNILGKSIMKE